jgi:hypothetical protein
VTAALVVPKDWSELTPDWMTTALAEHHPGAVVTAVTVGMRDDGTNRSARLALTYSAGSGSRVRLRQNLALAQRYSAAYEDLETAQALSRLTT